MNELTVDPKGNLLPSKQSEREKIEFKKGLLASEKTMANRKNAGLQQINSVAETSNSILNNLKVVTPRKSPRRNPYSTVDPTVISKGAFSSPDLVRRSPRHTEVANSVKKPTTSSGSRSAPKAKRTPKTSVSTGSVAGDLLRLGTN